MNIPGCAEHHYHLPVYMDPYELHLSLDTNYCNGLLIYAKPDKYKSLNILSICSGQVRSLFIKPSS